MGAEASCCSTSDGREPLVMPTDKEIKKVFKKVRSARSPAAQPPRCAAELTALCAPQLDAEGDSSGKLTWHQVEQGIDKLWDDCGEQWAKQERKGWMKKKKSKKKDDAVVKLKLFMEILEDAAETEREWRTEPLGSRKRPRRGSSDSDSDSDSEGGRGGSRSPRPSSTRGSPRQRKTAGKYEGKSKSELKELCRENGLSRGGDHEELVSRLVNAALGDDSDDDAWDDRAERKIAKKFEKLTESQLRKQLRKAGMAESGKKQALIRRLVKGRQEPPGWDSSDDDSDDDSDE